jgi:16S rRNA (cytidine1402-2'-O)-methyltransferase
MTGILTLVATPIGNLKDISPRAVEALAAADLIVCEDTRHSGRLLGHHGISKPMLALFQGKERSRTEAALKALLDGKHVALITDAGMPAIQDPGFLLVRAAVEKGVAVTAVPGPCAMIMALAISGLPTDRFLFEGFLPPKEGARRRRIEAWKALECTAVIYESVYKIKRTLADIEAVLGDVRVAVARELTKKFEEVIRGRVSQVRAVFETKEPQGEFVVVIEPVSKRPPEE